MDRDKNVYKPFRKKANNPGEGAGQVSKFSIQHKKVAGLCRQTLGEVFKTQVLPSNTRLTESRKEGGASEPGEGAFAGCVHWQILQALCEKEQGWHPERAWGAETFPLLWIHLKNTTCGKEHGSQGYLHGLVRNTRICHVRTQKRENSTACE